MVTPGSIARVGGSRWNAVFAIYIKLEPRGAKADDTLINESAIMLAAAIVFRAVSRDFWASQVTLNPLAEELRNWRKGAR